MQAGARAAYPFLRKHATDAERILEAAGASARLANLLSDKEQMLLTADLSAIGLRPGRIQLTLPERLTIKWMLDHKYSFGGVYPDITNPGANFFSQYPLEGGRYRAGGNVSDLFISAGASHTAKGISLAIDGSYFHQQVATAARDASQDMILRSQGYQTERIRDTEVYLAGVLDMRMRSIMRI